MLQLFQVVCLVLQAESQLSAFKTDHERFVEETEEVIRKLRDDLGQVARQKTDITGQLEEERR